MGMGHIPMEFERKVDAPLYQGWQVVDVLLHNLYGGIPCFLPTERVQQGNGFLHRINRNQQIQVSYGALPDVVINGRCQIWPL